MGVPKRGRNSHLRAIPTIPGRGRPEPPKGMGAAEATVWRTMVSAMPDHWFSAASQPVLRALCSHVVTSDALAQQVSEALEADDWAAVDRLTKIQERESKAVADLSSKLRLLPKSKWSQEKASTLEALNPTTRPWEAKS